MAHVVLTRTSNYPAAWSPVLGIAVGNQLDLFRISFSILSLSRLILLLSVGTMRPAHPL
jgi:hypothetical protein